MTSPELHHDAGRDPGTAPLVPPADEKAQRRAAVHAFRPRRTVPAVVTSLLLAAAALVTFVGAVAALARGRAQVPPLTWLAPVGRTHWSDPAALTTAAVACLLGILLLVLALTPGRPRAIPIASEDPRTVTGITRTGLSRHLATVAAKVDGVSRARVRLRRDRVHVTAATPLRDASGLPDEVTQAVVTRLEELRPLRPVRVRVTVRQRGD
ncbi:DUF6286 domain-containing protein [Sphaerisporangium sp. NPDC049002]|uniref:DUF6286 domain-containing protein n=1 Tax=unclassified Sphaerisporangium TaxID=2630420 RepID=UPI0034091B64